MQGASKVNLSLILAISGRRAMERVSEGDEGFKVISKALT